jgi:predicted nucleic acid-binding Zn ribbon protein
MARAIHEVLAGVRSVDQLSRVVSEQVYELLRARAAAGAQARLKAGRKPVIQPTDVVKVRYQSPAEDVIESVVLLSNRQRAKAVTIRLESQNGSWKATNIGFL